MHSERGEIDDGIVEELKNVIDCTMMMVVLCRGRATKQGERRHYEELK